jgi:hypothetical protein
MKALFSFIVCAFAALTVGAQTASSSVTFFSQDGQKFWVIMDGIKQNDKPDANVKVTGLTNSNYRAKIIFADNTIPSIDKNIQTQDFENKYFDATYNIQKDKKGKLVVRISSFSESKGGPTSAQTVPFHADDKYGSDYNTYGNGTPAQTTTNQTTTTTTRDDNVGVQQNVTGGAGSDKATIKQNVNATGNGVGTSQSITDPDGNTVKMDMNMGTNGGGIKIDDGMGGGVNMNLGINMTGMDGAGTTTTTTTKTTTTTTYSSSSTGGGIPDNRPPVNNTPPPPPSNSNGCVYPASSADMGNLKGSIQKQSFSDNKMNVAKTFLKNKCLSVSQIKDVMGLFSFEADKLSFAKLAYDRCVDKENYYMVSDAFSFSSSNDELTDYINSK